MNLSTIVRSSFVPIVGAILFQIAITVPVKAVETPIPNPIPAGATAAGCTQCVINEFPLPGDIAPAGPNGQPLYQGNYKWFDGIWYDSTKPSLSDYTTSGGVLAMSYNSNNSSCIVSTPLNFTTGALPVLTASKGFYVEFTYKLSDNNTDHWPAVWLEPVEHNGNSSDDVYQNLYPSDAFNYERWMELDVDEGGFVVGTCTTVHSWTGVAGNYQNSQNLNNVSYTALDRTQFHTFGASYTPPPTPVTASNVTSTSNTGIVTFWLDGVKGATTQLPYVPAVADLQHYYLILDADSHGQDLPYTMYVKQVDAFIPPTTPPASLSSAVSSQVQGSDTFNLPLALSGTVTIEPRRGSTVGNYSIVMTFNETVTSLTATLGLQAGQSGTVVGTAGTPVINGSTVTVNLTGVGDAQRLNLQLSNIQPGNVTASVPINILWGDVNAVGVVNGGDYLATRNQLNATLTSSNFQYDVGCFGGIVNGGDALIVRSLLNTYLP